MSAVKISPEFKSQTYRAIFSIVLFIIVYLLLFGLAIGIFAGCAYLAFIMVTAAPSFVTLMLGIGLVGVGFFIFYFMVKFLFTKNKSDYSHLTEINIHDEPELYKMIQDLVDEIGTDFPKKIYLSPDVNASVFYDSSFWSMFFPIKKNLHIGMGLVNTTTVTELRGILAHEFGHFSQKTMKVGSYVYNVNRVIYNLLYENDDYHNAISSWASKSGYFAILLYVAVGFNRLIQSLLQMMYKVVNLSYMGLSREMEFHADEIAANVVGSEPMINSMLRMDLTSNSFDRVINYYNGKINESITTSNIYPQHLLATNFFAGNSKIDIVDNLPRVESGYYERFNKSKLVIKNQWASHPSTEERVNAFKTLSINLSNIDNRPANTLFKNISEIQQKITKKMFETVVYPETPLDEEINQFETSIQKEYQENKYPDLYNGYYDNHTMDAMDLDKILENPNTALTFDELYNNDIVELAHSKTAQNNDLAVLKQIAGKEFKIKTFDYDGNKYKSSAAKSLADNLDKDIAENKEKLHLNDIEIFKYFYGKAQQKGVAEKLVKRYKDFFSVDSEHETKAQLYVDMFEKFSFAYEQHQIEDINNRMKNYAVLESRFKEQLKAIQEDERYQKAITPDMKKECDAYLEKDLVYFDGRKYDDEAIGIKNNIIHLYLFILQRSYFLNHKEILDFQATLV
ncbi:M48 family metallopeptidase [Flavobacterium terrisoli]|uniref:M48 family metallopeptidase n=1 Tax=Flavobacterium terrisoli TaxID=3242195 RepID=UPI002543EE2A|nr:M48 family metalloprotease [Flavobacterium buctense]